MSFDPSSILTAHHLRDTQQRRNILRALDALGIPATHADIHAWIMRKKIGINLVTVYRIMDKFEELSIVHRHPSSGRFLLCSLMEKPGHHGMLSCTKCGKVEEFASRALCTVEDHIAQSSGFRSSRHVSEIIGTCPSCS